MEYDFIVGFTLFNKTGFKTRFRHFDNLKVAKMFASNVNLKDNSKIYVDLKYMQDKIKAKIEEVQNMKAKAKDIVFKSSLNYIETELKSLLEKE